MNHKMDKTFEEGFEEYVLDMKARNLRKGTIFGILWDKDKVSMEQIIEYLAKNDIPSERKYIYADFERLRDLGYDTKLASKICLPFLKRGGSLP